MSSEEIKRLKRKLSGVKSQLTSLEKFLNSITHETNIETLDLESRLNQKVLPLSEKFESIQDAIEALIEDGSEDETANRDERANFDDRYYSICGKFKSLIKKINIESPVASTSDISQLLNDFQMNNRVGQIGDTNNSSAQNINSARPTAHRHLPDIKIPVFSGNIENWLSFYDSFNSVIHNDKDLPTIQKFHYLKDSVTGDAANIIASLETTSENYTVAWELLKGRYHNKKIVIDNHVKALFDLKPISKEFSIRRLCDIIQKHLRALQALSIDVDQWNFILIHLIRSKFNSYTIKKWEEFICDIDLPTPINMLDFLARRSQIEETKAAANQANFPKPSHSKYNSQPSQNLRHPFTDVATSTTPKSNDSQSKINLKAYLLKKGTLLLKRPLYVLIAYEAVIIQKIAFQEFQAGVVNVDKNTIPFYISIDKLQLTRI